MTTTRPVSDGIKPVNRPDGNPGGLITLASERNPPVRTVRACRNPQNTPRISSPRPASAWPPFWRRQPPQVAEWGKPSSVSRDTFGQSCHRSSRSASRNREAAKIDTRLHLRISKHTFHSRVQDVLDSRILTAISLKRQLCGGLWPASRHWEVWGTSMDSNTMRGPVRLAECPISLAACSLGASHCASNPRAQARR